MRKQELSSAVFSSAQKIFPGGVNSPVRAFRSVGGEPFIVDYGKGPYLFDIDGNRYVDFINSWGPLVLGHAFPAVVEAIAAQAKRGTSFGASHELELRLALKVQELFPSMEMLRFVSSGTEAGMSVVRLARGFTGREKILKFEGCYHGHVDSLLAKAGSGVATLAIPECSGIPGSVTGNTIVAPYNDLTAVTDIFKIYDEKIAAVILEPVVGNAGFIEPEPGFLAGLRAVTKKYGALLIFDEVMTGFRVALGGAQALFDVEPDLTMLGKVIGGGLPVGAYGGRADIMQMIAPLGPVYQAGTLSGNPLAMTAGLVTLEEWTKPGVFESVSCETERLVQGMIASARSHSVPFTASSLGSMFGFFFSDGPVRSFSEAQKSDRELFNKFFHLMLDSGVYLAPSPYEAGFVSAAHVGEAIDFSLEQVSQAISSLTD
jgi:glutamate-1-semialdehyde 2,1-aminomutase